MNAMYNMYNVGLPAAESAKLTPARMREPQHTYADAVRAATAEQDAATATAARRQPAHHLSGFARA